MARAGEREMPVLCELGWHRADPLARWNAGYYFTTCGRCGRDLVRTAYGGWRVPKGFRVVWQPEPPATVMPVELVPEEPSAVAAPVTDQMELPIQEVLRQLDAEEAQQATAEPHAAEGELIETADIDEPLPEEEPREAEILPEGLESVEATGLDPEPELEPEVEEEEELVPELVRVTDEHEEEPEFEMEPAPAVAAEAPPQPPMPAATRSAYVDDFMEEDDWFMKEEPGFGGWDEATEVAVAAPVADIVDDERERVSNRSGKVRYGDEVGHVQQAPSAFLGMIRSFDRTDDDAPPIVEEVRDPEAETRSYRRNVAATVVASFGILALLAAIAGGWDMRQSEAATPAPAAAAAEMQSAQTAAPAAPSAAERAQTMQAGISRPRETGFVTASLLNCREAPAEQAEPVRILPRGETVEVLALEPAWASISHRGRQCWASTRYLSAQQPL